MSISCDCSVDGYERLDQLLAEIKRRNYNIQMGWGDEAHIHVMHRERHTNRAFHADTLEDAAAQALLWILEREHP